MHNLIDNRQIRVFISSTFRDMQDERDYLMKRTFPKLRKLAAERDVTLTELDLRWGITEEEAKSGKVVEICLREIENCIPFFIGIIGNRYGWVPEKGDLGGNITERFSDVKSYLDHHLSVTEMEMQFGVLCREDDMHAYFYIKEEKEDADNPEMLDRLKETVRASRYPSATYSSPEDLGIQVQQAFTNLLNQLFPESHLSELEKERIGQRSFMNQLCQNYIHDDKNFQVLDEWVQDWDHHQMVVTGASGLGKSAFIANWLKEKLQEENRDYDIIYHFIGNGGSESNHIQFIKTRLINEIKDHYGWTGQDDTSQGVTTEDEEDEEDEDNELETLFTRIASEGKKPLLIVLDAINQVIDTADDNTNPFMLAFMDNINNLSAKSLFWLPDPSKNIKILVSTIEDDFTIETCKKRHFIELELQPLDLEKRQQLIKEYLHLYGKKLTDAQIVRIATDRQCENTLVLKSLLDELINFGTYEKLDEKIEYYLSKDTIEDFYQALLQSYEESYKDYGDDFVKTILSLIAVSQYGLSEAEILSITNYKQLYWSHFYCAFIGHLTFRDGLLTFSHQYIEEAISKRYLDDTDWEMSCRCNIYNFLIKEKNKRYYTECVYQHQLLSMYL